jgi:hypothetical protein
VLTTQLLARLTMNKSESSRLTLGLSEWMVNQLHIQMQMHATSDLYGSESNTVAQIMF